jgi:outer membrane receptor for ferrienterochelin and colicins
MGTPGRASPWGNAASRTTARSRYGLAALLCLSLKLSAATAADPTANGNLPGNLADLSLEDLMNVRIERVVSASRYEQKVTQAPAAVTVVTAQQIQRFGYRTLADILRSLPGLYVTYDRDFSSLGFRGFNRPGDANDRTLLLVDGHRMNDDFYGAALIGRELILDIDLIERVEIIRGPSSSIYGSSAFLGVINIITRKGAAIAGTEASVAGGSFETYGERLTYGKQLGEDLDVVLSASHFDSAGPRRLFFPEFDTPETNHGIAENADGEKAQSFYGRLTYHELTLSAAYTLREKQVPIALGRTIFNDNREKTTGEQVFFDLHYEHALSATSTIAGRAHYDQYGFRGTFPSYLAVLGEPTTSSIVYTKNVGEGVGAEVQWTTKLRDRHTVLFGVEYREALKLLQASFEGQPRTYIYLSDHQGRSVGAYSQVDLAVLSRLRINAGLRYDRYDNFGSTVNPRLGAIYNPRASTTIKLLYGRAYRAPNAYELYFEVPRFAKASHRLTPETIATYELVFEQYFPNGLKLRASGYRYDIRNLISLRQDPADGLLVFQNVDQAKAKGVEIELEGHFAYDLSARLSYALQSAKDEKTEKELTDSPRHLAKLNLDLPMAGDRLHAGFELQYQGSVKTFADKRVADFLVANATLLFPRVLPPLELSLSVYNLFDEAYAYPGSPTDAEDFLRQDGRTFRLKGTYKF